MKKFVFLDIDGVLNYDKWWDTDLHYEIYRTKGELESHFDPERIQYLNHILDKVPDSELILISSWKSMTSIELKPYGDYPNGIFDVMNNVGINISRKVPSIQNKRDEEIMEFLNEYEYPKFVILDDDDYYTSSTYSSILYPYWIKTSYYGDIESSGLTLELSNKAINILNGKERNK